MPEHTGRVRVVFKGGMCRVVEASSYGDAASKVKVPNGSIVRFEWTSAEPGDYPDMRGASNG
jgi:hypothetical protein